MAGGRALGEAGAPGHPQRPAWRFVYCPTRRAPNRKIVRTSLEPGVANLSQRLAPSMDLELPAHRVRGEDAGSRQRNRTGKATVPGELRGHAGLCSGRVRREAGRCRDQPCTASMLDGLVGSTPRRTRINAILSDRLTPVSRAQSILTRRWHGKEETVRRSLFGQGIVRVGHILQPSFSDGRRIHFGLDHGCRPRRLSAEHSARHGRIAGFAGLSSGDLARTSGVRRLRC